MVCLHRSTQWYPIPFRTKGKLLSKANKPSLIFLLAASLSSFHTTLPLTAYPPAHWPHCPSSIPSTFSSQGCCTCCSLHIGSSSSRHLQSSPLYSFKSLLSISPRDAFLISLPKMALMDSLFQYPTLFFFITLTLSNIKLLIC